MQGTKATNKTIRDDLSIPSIGKTRVEVMRFDSDAKSNANRAAACQRARNYKADRTATLQKEARKNHFLDLVTSFIGNLILGIAMFAMLGLALYFGRM